MSKGTVYLIHFDRPFKHARHYMGWTGIGVRRFNRHAAGHGARLLAVIQAAGIGWWVVRQWSGRRALERRLKKRGGHARLCPDCGYKSGNGGYGFNPS